MSTILREQVARLSAELADRVDELVASHAIERDLLAVAQDYKTRLAAVEQERDGLAAAYNHLRAQAIYLLATPEEDREHLDAVREALEVKSGAGFAAILATVRAKARAEGLMIALDQCNRRLNDQRQLAALDTRALEVFRNDLCRMVADAEEAGSAPKT